MQALVPSRLKRVAWITVSTVFIAWGTFSAVAVFAVRYDLWTDGSADHDEREWATASPLPAGTALNSEDWADVLSPLDIWSIVQSSALTDTVDQVTGHTSHWPVVRVNLLWDPVSSRAVWSVHATRPGCPCPLDAASRWDHVRALVDPLSGDVLSVRRYEGLSAAEFRTMGTREWIAMVTYPDLL
jgi:hypothetical protein